MRLWRWFEGLELGGRVAARVEAWPRGGGKSSTAELGCAYLACRMTRRFVLYVCGTQEQADLHVQAIGSLLERLGVGRACNRYGSSKGWRRQQLRTDQEFNVAGYGLDAATRGIKIDSYRPDLIVFDDIDDRSDTPETVAKKISAVTAKVLPTGSVDCAVLFVQNLIHEDGIVARLVDGRADFLHGREVPPVEPAVRGLAYELVAGEDGARRYAITAGEATWAGQDLETCERQLNDWGETAFLREAQHRVFGSSGYFFDETRMEVVAASAVPRLLRVCLAWDLAGTQGGGDFTAAVLMGAAANGVAYVLNVWRGQWGSERVESTIESLAASLRVEYPGLVVRLPQDPGQAGKAQAARLRRVLGALQVSRPVTGRKAVRARGWAAKCNSGNARLVAGAWNDDFRREHREFREDERHSFDDQVDAATDAFEQVFGRSAGAGSARARVGGGSREFL